MAATGVLYNLQQRQQVLIIIFRMQTRHRIRVPHQGARRGHIQGMLNALVKLSC